MSLNVEHIPYQEKDERVKYCVSFEKDFTSIVGINAVTPTSFWVYNLNQKFRLVDVENNKIICNNDFKEKSYFNFCPLRDKNSFLTLDLTNLDIIRIEIVQEEGDKSCTNARETRLISVKEGNMVLQDNNTPVMMVQKTGNISLVVFRKEGCACFTDKVPYIQLYSDDGVSLCEEKLVYRGKKLFSSVCAIAQNNNGHVCLAGDSGADRRQMVLVVLDIQLRPHFIYRGKEPGPTGSNITFVPQSLACTSKNEIVILNNNREECLIEILDENGTFLTSWPVESVCDESRASVMSIDGDDKLWLVLDSDKVICLDLKLRTNVY